MEVKVFQTKVKVAEEFSKFLIEKSANKKTYHIALSGGSTPKIVFDVLAEEFADAIDWNAIHLYWGDERCVDPEDEQSNYRMTKEHLISKVAIPKENIHRIKGENDPKSEAERYSEVLETELPKELGLPQFDMVILGMGDDGHTASIFPHEINLWVSPDNCEVAIHPESGQKRVSLTGRMINNAKTVVFLVTGESKAEKVKIIVDREEGYLEFPASHVAPKTKDLVWFLDAAAAKLLTSFQS
ncbi:6-phosphogluconolactonase [Maribacter hydrothermalis]|uniref:6-phosphogluconolactonase n=1 Tax=Maribacter hydrothermalis TaxID=1836467 RepID=A0A1B7Z832_9FLAO|nr:6-phosphogluconolactonase [Maribacter hydrothermalis]APQ15881.1 6-phosphogluconolactonase [Maribacter hydrothermalis]OBR38740.1 6-phosphogluconolactonase [Maribacter hydrothermalis]